MAGKNVYDPVLGELRKQYFTEADIKKIAESVIGTPVQEVISVATYADLEAIENPSTEAIYIVTSNNNLYRYNGSGFIAITGEVIDNAIYVSSLNALLSMTLENASVYRVLHATQSVNTYDITLGSYRPGHSAGGWQNQQVRKYYATPLTYDEAYALLMACTDANPIHLYGVPEDIKNVMADIHNVTVDDTYVGEYTFESYSLSVNQTGEKTLVGRKGWATVANDRWAWENYAMEEALQQVIDNMTGKQDKTDNSLLTTVKTIVGAINELWNKFADYALANHNHNGVYQPAGDYASRSHGHSIGAIEGLSDALAGKAASNHNHDGVYQPAGNYAASDHTHSQYLTQHQDISGKQDKTDNSLLTTVKTIVGAINELWNKFADYLKGIQHVTYAQLVTLRNNSGLVAGQWYRITDYMTTVANDTEARSAGHPFDLLVMATSANTLSEDAKAVKSSRDTDGYFADASLNAWKVWYCLDNDDTRYKWADTENGKGVIWRMIDEWGNECPYDFKNVQFKRYAISDITSSTLTADALTNLQETFCYDQNGGKCFATKDVYGNWIPSDSNGASYEVDETIYEWYYTFHGLSSDDGETITDGYDMSTNPFKMTDECIQYQEDDGCGINSKDECHDNIIKPAYWEYDQDDEYYKGRLVLNNIVFLNGLSYCYYNEDDGYWEYNSSSCYGNVFGVECKNNTFGNYFQRNTFGNYCYNNTFGNSCGGNTFGNYFQQNTSGNYCYNNTFGNSCGGNTFGNYCYNNTFGNGCYYNTFGNYCYNNTFGNYVRYITVHDGVQYVAVTGGSDYSYIQNAQILNGTHGQGSDNRLQISFQSGADYCQFAGLNSSGILKIWVPADAA